MRPIRRLITVTAKTDRVGLVDGVVCKVAALIIIDLFRPYKQHTAAISTTLYSPYMTKSNSDGYSHADAN